MDEQEPEAAENAAAETEKKPFWKKLKKPGKNLFWAWIAYQCIKGTTTLTLIWIPLFYVWWHSTHH